MFLGFPPQNQKPDCQDLPRFQFDVVDSTEVGAHRRPKAREVFMFLVRPQSSRTFSRRHFWGSHQSKLPYYQKLQCRTVSGSHSRPNIGTAQHVLEPQTRNPKIIRPTTALRERRKQSTPARKATQWPCCPWLWTWFATGEPTRQPGF